jgi:hypothetical protein
MAEQSCEMPAQMSGYAEALAAQSRRITATAERMMFVAWVCMLMVSLYFQASETSVRLSLRHTCVCLRQEARPPLVSVTRQYVLRGAGNLKELPLVCLISYRNNLFRPNRSARLLKAVSPETTSGDIRCIAKSLALARD